MQDDRAAVPGQPDIELDRGDAELDGAAKPGERVLLVERGHAAVAHDDGPPLAGEKRVRVSLRHGPPTVASRLARRPAAHWIQSSGSIAGSFGGFALPAASNVTMPNGRSGRFSIANTRSRRLGACSR